MSNFIFTEVFVRKSADMGGGFVVPSRSAPAD
jgi:hypothetical protein